MGIDKPEASLRRMWQLVLDCEPNDRRIPMTGWRQAAKNRPATGSAMRGILTSFAKTSEPLGRFARRRTSN